MKLPKRTRAFKFARATIPAELRTPVLWRSGWQVANTFVPFFAICATMHLALDVSYWLALPLAIVAAAFLVRIFIIQHDCGHGAFFRNAAANNWMGRLCSILTLTPYDHWRREHHGHHTRWNCLDHRGPEIDPYSKCLTVREYRARTGFSRFFYRLQRHPAVMFLLMPPLIFLFVYRLPLVGPTRRLRAHTSIHLTTAAVGVAGGALVAVAGLPEALLVQLPINILGSITGAWLFFVQHQFDGTNWVRKNDWEFGSAVVSASSHLKLPPLLRWFTGNIGLHHIHHFDYRIPNYNLVRCIKYVEAFAPAREISLWSGLRATRLALWDEDRNELVRFSDVAGSQTGPV